MNSKQSLLLLALVLALTACHANSHESYDSSAESLSGALESIGKVFGVAEPGHGIPSVSGDYNGDGVLDVAFIAIPAGNTFWTLNIYFGSEQDEGTYLSLAEHSPDTSLDEVRIATAAPGKYGTVCSYSPGGCRDDEPGEITMKFDGIYLEVLEASGSLIYLDTANNKFVRHRLSD